MAYQRKLTESYGVGILESEYLVSHSIKTLKMKSSERKNVLRNTEGFKKTYKVYCTFEGPEEQLENIKVRLKLKSEYLCHHEKGILVEFRFVLADCNPK